MENDISKKYAFITIVGRPNVGKSSLLNELIEHKISIVSNKPQTTRTRVTGILTKDDVQLIFIDTPGIHAPRNQLDRHMISQANDSMVDVDVCMLVTEAGRRICDEEKRVIERLNTLKVPSMLVINKVDLLRDKSVLMGQIEQFSKEFDFDVVVPISVIKRDGVSDVITELKKFSHEGGYVFDSDALTDQPERVLIAEMIREKLLSFLDKEVPHGIAVQIEQMRKRSDDVMDVHATIYCEKPSHKGIVIGKHGTMLKQIGVLARKDIESFFGYKTNLQLWVKVKEDWRNRENLIMPFIYDDLNKTSI